MRWIRQLPVLLAGGLLVVGVSEGAPLATGDSALFLSARREPLIVVLEGRVPSAAIRQRWAEAARLADGGQVVDHVRTSATKGEPWIDGATNQLSGWLRLLEEGEIRWTPGKLSLSGRAKSPEALKTLSESARRALPTAWVLESTVRAEGAGKHAVLNVRWEAGAMRCEGFLPQDAWRARKVAWTVDPGLQLVLSDAVNDSQAAAPAWLDGLPIFMKLFQADVREGVIQVDDSAIVLRGKVVDLVSKLRAGREARALVGKAVEVRNFLEVDSSARAPDAIIAAAVPAPMKVAAVPAPVQVASVPAPVQLAAAAPAPMQVFAVPAPVQVASVPPPVILASAAPPVAAPAPPTVSKRKPSAKPTKAGTISIVADSTGLRLDGELPDNGMKSSLAGTCGAVPGDRKVADQTEVSPSVRAEAWQKAIPACLLAISEYLAQGEFHIGNGKVTLQGIAKTVPGRDRLLAAVARALPNDMRLDDHTTVPAEAAPELFSRNIYFNTGSTYIKPEHREHLREVVAAIKAGGGDVTLLIKGHADPRGDSQINDELSRERAKAVFDTLVKQGVDDDLLEFVGVGATESVDGTGEYVWKQERRVELTLVK